MPGKYYINPIYQGGYSTLDPEKYSSYGDLFTGYHVPASAIGAPTKPDTANQIAQVNMLVNQGIIPIEVGVLRPEVFDQIPKQLFKEINRKAKLAGAEISVHAPIIEASGITEQGYDEGMRKTAEEQLKQVVERTSPLNEKGGMIITIHGAGAIPGVEYVKTEKGKKEEKIVVVNRETGKITTVLQEEEKFYPGEEKIKNVLTPRDELEALNNTEWSNSISQISHYKENADRLIEENFRFIPRELIDKIMQSPEKERAKLMNMLTPTQIQAYNNIFHAQTYLDDVRQSVNSLFNKAYKTAKMDKDKRTLEKLNKLAEQYKEELKKAYASPSEFIPQLSNALQNLIAGLSSIQPKLYAPVEEYAIDRSSETFSNVALHAYKKYKDKAPVISIENMFPGMAFSYGKELNDLIIKSKEKFVEKAVSQGIMSESEAKKYADKVIGVTFDMGHLNIMRKKGFEKEDILKEINEIAKHIKHVHVTDNFGYSDSHLPPGMGNVPVKEILEKLEQEGIEVKKIVEAGGFVQHFGISPFPYALESLGANMFATGQEPYWNQKLGLYQGYTGGFGMMLPQANYAMFGAGFSQLPIELGGNVPGTGSRMSGKPME